MNYIESGCNPRDDKLGSQAPIFEGQFDVIPRSEWQNLIEEYGITDRPNVEEIYDQGQEGACTSNAGGQGVAVTTVDQLGEAYFVKFSAISLYKRCGNSPNSGSTVGKNVQELRNVGILPETKERQKMEKMGLNPSHSMPNTGFYTPMPVGWQETAKYFRLGEYFDIGSMDGFMSALLNGFTVHYGRRGHSVLGVTPKWQNNQFYVEYANSWNENWGNGGFGLDTESGLRRSGAINQYGAYAYRTIVVTDELLSLGK